MQDTHQPAVVSPRTRRWPLRLLLAALSGVATWPLSVAAGHLDTRLPLPLIEWQTVFVGTIFALLVLVPWIPTPRTAPLRVLGLTVASILAYAVALVLADADYGWTEIDVVVGLPLAGVVGALLVVFAIVRIAPASGSWKLYGLVAAAGFLGALAFFPAIFEDGDWFAMMAYICWQVLVAGGLWLGLASGQRSIRA